MKGYWLINRPDSINFSDMPTPGRRADDPLLPRRPQRANGVARFNVLVDAAERVIGRSGVEELSIASIAAEAATPAASVYHFFPTPTAAQIAVAERHIAKVVDVVSRPVRKTGDLTPVGMLVRLMRRAAKYYNDHPVASRMILGSSKLQRVYQLDTEANSALIHTLCASMEREFGVPANPELASAIKIVITLVDAVWGLSVAEAGYINPAYAEQAEKVVERYLSPIVGGVRACRT